MSRRSDLDKGSVTGGLINEAYDEVKKVADNIDEVIKVANNLATLSTFSVKLIVGVGDSTVEGDMNNTNWLVCYFFHQVFPLLHRIDCIW